MRLLRSLLRLYHASRALSLQRRSNWHAERAAGLRAASQGIKEFLIPSAGDLRATGSLSNSSNSSALSAADLFFLASIVGVGIAGVWIGIVWRAM